MHGRKTLVIAVLLGAAFVALALIIGLSWANSRRITVQMRWSNTQPTGIDQRLLRPLSEDAVRLEFVDAPDTYVGINYPGLLPRLRSLNRKEVAVEFKVACELWSGRPAWFTVRSIAGIEVEAAADQWEESIGDKDLDPLAAACAWR